MVIDMNTILSLVALAQVACGSAHRLVWCDYARSDVFDKRWKMMEAWATYLAQDIGKV